MNWSALWTVLPSWLLPCKPTTFTQMKAIWKAGDEQAIERLRRQA